MILGGAMQFSLLFLDALVIGALLPELPALAATLTGAPKNVPLVVALIVGALFLGRAGGALWCHYRSQPSSTNNHYKNDARHHHSTSLKSILVAALVYSVVWFIQGFINRLSAFFLGQFLIGFLIGRHSISHSKHLKNTPTKSSSSSLPLLLGAMIGFLIGGLYDAQHTFDPCPEDEGKTCTRWADGAPMAPVGVAVLALAAGTGLLSLVVVQWQHAAAAAAGGREGRREGGREGEGEYRRLSGGSVGVAAAANGPLSEAELLAALQEAEEGGREGGRVQTPHHHLHLLRIPPRYVKGCNGDMGEAARRWKETLAWREEQGIDRILLEPQRNFALIKECYPHYLHRRDRGGRPVYYELLG